MLAGVIDVKLTLVLQRVCPAAAYAHTQRLVRTHVLMRRATASEMKEVLVVLEVVTAHQEVTQDLQASAEAEAVQEEEAR